MRLEAKFVTSAFAPEGYPRWDRAEVALAGRSNVGKSSMLNALAASKNLARTSRTPGRTRALNFFAVGDDLAIVDLPGYGFAKMARTEAARVAAMMNDYLGHGEHLAGLVLLVDARRGPEREELELATLAGGRGVKLIAVATKCDKLRRSERAAALARFTPLGIEPILCSALSSEGIDDLRRRIIGCAREARRATALAGDDGTPEARGR
ncbi:MAG TPA: ribosome biogenesis GTP-binding protein YihA/YsxC [Candidatus Binataceae bacterium]|nr:ribosome biogenesis GTP-binding protein YihA/YsxC [Candidatus Binataceae bacterium]